MFQHYPMKNRTSIRKSILPPLTVSHKALTEISAQLNGLPDAIIQTDLDFNITGWNYAAGQLHGVPGAMGKNLFGLIRIDFLHSTLESVMEDLKQQGTWEDEVIFHRHDGEKFFFRTTASFVFNGRGDKTGIIFLNHNITNERNTIDKLAETEATYKKLVNTLIDGVLMMNADGVITACNKSAYRILGVNENELLGKKLGSNWKIIKPDGTDFPPFEFPATVSLQTGFPQRNIKMGLYQPNEMLVWVSVSSEALIRQGEFEPYAVVISFSDITDTINREEELRKSNERFYHVSKIATDAIWDLDLATNEIYRSEAFYELSGYSREDIKPDLNWWFDKVHPDDRERVKSKVNEHISQKTERWEDEYSFLCADGQYKYLLDSGIILYKYGKPVRILGAICDLTEKKKLELQLFNEQKQKHQAIEKAAISAQEKERSAISSELHDNVNQILMSSKLFLDSAISATEDNKSLLEKALDYQMLAMEEIRKLSRKLNTSLVKVVGLQKSIADIVNNLTSFQHMDVIFKFDMQLERILSEDQKLMIYRIVQEQTNNIIKYSAAEKVSIILNENEKHVLLKITDDGKGFDTSRPSGGIGFINIHNRVEAFNGQYTLTSAPGNGCTLQISFPVNNL